VQYGILCGWRVIEGQVAGAIDGGLARLDGSDEGISLTGTPIAETMAKSEDGQNGNDRRMMPMLVLTSAEKRKSSLS